MKLSAIKFRIPSVILMGLSLFLIFNYGMDNNRGMLGFMILFYLGLRQAIISNNINKPKRRLKQNE